MVETLNDLVSEWEEGGGGGPVGTKTMLGIVEGEGIEFRKQEAFQDLGSGTEQGNRAIAGTEFDWFAGLWKRDNYCIFSNRWYVGMVIREVIEVSEETAPEETEMFQMVNG